MSRPQTESDDAATRVVTIPSLGAGTCLADSVAITGKDIHVHSYIDFKKKAVNGAGAR